MLKIKFFLLLVLREALPTSECLVRRLELQKKKKKVICVIRMVKILNIFVRIALSLKEFGIVLSIIVILLSFIKVISWTAFK